MQDRAQQARHTHRVFCRSGPPLTGRQVENALDGRLQRLVARLVYIAGQVCGAGGWQGRASCPSKRYTGGWQPRASSRAAVRWARALARHVPRGFCASRLGLAPQHAPVEEGCEIWCCPTMRLPSASSAPSVMCSSARDGPRSRTGIGGRGAWAPPTRGCTTRPWRFACFARLVPRQRGAAGALPSADCGSPTCADGRQHQRALGDACDAGEEEDGGLQGPARRWRTGKLHHL